MNQSLPTVGGSSFRRGLTRIVLFPLVILGVFLLIFWWQISSLVAASNWVDHTDQVIAQGHIVRERMIDMETGLRGYQVTQSTTFLEPYQTGAQTIDGAIDTLEQLVLDNADQTQRVKNIRAQVETWKQFALDALKQTQSGVVSSLEDQLHGKALMDGFRQQLRDFISTENNFRTERITNTQQTTQAVVAITLFAAIVGGSLALIFIRSRLVTLSTRYENALKAANRQTAELKTQREWFEGTLSSLGDGVIATGRDGKVSFINGSAQLLTSWSSQEVMGKPLPDVFQLAGETTNTPFNATTTQLNAAVRPGYRPWNERIKESSLIDHNGREIPIESSISPIVGSDASQLGTVVVFRDLKDRRQSEARLRNSEKQYRDLANAMPLLLWTATPTGERDYFNRRWYEYTGLTFEQSKGANWQLAVCPEDLAAVQQQWQDSIKDSTPYEIEYRLKNGDGSYHWHLAKGLALTDESGKTTSWVGTLIDIDRQKQVEVMLNERAEDLRRISDRLEERNRELDQFAYITSHDLKAPLRGIANLSQWIEEDLEDRIDDDIRNKLDLLRGRVHRMEGLIDGILEYSRIGRVNINAEPVDVGVLLTEVVDLLSPPPEFTVTIAPNMPTIRTARLHLQQVFSNLIGNALKHAKRDKGEIKVNVKDIGKHYEFTVSDNGPGIAPEYHEKIFVIFQTLESRDKVEGSGLGLALVKKIVEQYGGKIWVKSAVGEGATFHFTWPK